ncbi:NAD(P)/FAD-dependent oxidoreductase, partial [Pseudooceanicola sp.]|uniref:NAD(P)/FAD-dependent oxidoreductase n=1 Tax=Pseudooceanicola sp. TaxID=1914328 RepID=UPI00351144C4
RRRIPLLRPDHCAAGLFDASAADIDVAALHQHYLKSFRAAGGQICTGAEVLALAQGGAGWQVETGSGVFSAAIVVNAAGAWADEIAQRAGLAPRGLVPKRRTAMIIAAPEGTATERWPMVIDVDEQFYLKPEAGKFLISPADETPSPPCDAQPEEIDVAICVDRIERAFDMRVHRIESKWAGLRSFLPDGNPLAGYDPAAPGFFWLAGQGGYGIQTAPALARAAAALINDVSLPDDIARAGVTPALLSGGLQEVAA